MFQISWRRLSFALPLVALVLTTLPQFAQASFPGENGRVATGSGAVFTIGASSATQTSSLSGNEAAWSPDGQRLVLTGTSSEYPFYPDLYTVNADGTGGKQLTDTVMVSETDPTWSPDGKRIAFYRVQTFFDDPDTVECMCTINADGSGLTDVGGGTEPAWSPDGSKIAFLAGDGFIYTKNLDGTGFTKVSSDRGFEPNWSPDGRKIAYWGYVSFGGSTRGEIFTVNTDGSGTTSLTSAAFPGHNISPAWSPDGTKIIFASNRDDNYELYEMNPDGTAQTRLTNSSGGESEPDWQPFQYPRPIGASPARLSLVPAYRECTAPNTTHGGPPLGGESADPSCTPQQSLSSAAAVGPSSLGFLMIIACPHASQVTPCSTVTAPDDKISVSITDVRSGLPTGPDYDPSPGGPDLTLGATLRITDRRNGANGDLPGTVVDVPFPSVPVDCNPTSDTAVGSSCTARTTVNALVPGIFTLGQRAIWELRDLKVKDSGPDQARGNADDQIFEASGIFNP